MRTSFDDHLCKLAAVFERLRKAGLKLKFGLVEGHLVALCQPLGADAIDDANTQVWIIWTWPAGSDVRHLYGLDWARAVSD